jgi:hypothetical protein
MRTYYFPIALLLAAPLAAQPTIQASHLPQAGDVWVLHQDTVGGSQFTPSAPASTAQTWNYTTAFNVHVSQTLQLMAPASVPGASNFPNADWGMGGSDQGVEVGIFYQNTASGMQSLGQFLEMPGFFSMITDVQNGLELPVPFTYGTTQTVTSVETSTSVYSGIPLPASQTRSHITTSISGDAHGTIMTPTYPSGVSVVRMRSQVTSRVDSTFSDASGTGNGPWVFEEVTTSSNETPSYSFLRAGVPMYVAQVSGDATSASYFGGTPTAVEENNANEITMFPNPATDMITFITNNADVRTLQVMDVTGRLQGEYMVQGSDRINLMTEGWNDGAYTYRCLNNAGEVTSQGRFMVVR